MRSIHLILTISLAAATSACDKGAPAAEEKKPEAAKMDAGHDHAKAPDTAFKLPSTEGSVSFVGLEDGQTLKGPLADGKVKVSLKFGAEGITIGKAGVISDSQGHHHVLINTDDIPKGTVIPADEKHVHFGGGQTETELALAPGDYTLTMQLADGLHRSYGEAWRAKVKIKVAAQ